MSSRREGIVAGYDGSPGGEQALRWAVREARARGCALTVCLAWAPQYLPVLDEPGIYDLARQRGEEILASGVRYASGLLGEGRVTPLLARGSAARVLCERSAMAEITVLGTRGHGGVSGLTLGSVPGQVTRHSRGPVVVVRENRMPNHAPRPVVLGADGSAASEPAIRFAFREAEARRLPLLAVCALTDTPTTLGGARALEEDFARALSGHEKEFPEVTVMRQVSVRSPRAELLDEAAGAPLLVVGSRGRGGLHGMALGSVAHAVLHHAPCPVAIVREY